jgi:hypothetical protein
MPRKPGSGLPIVRRSSWTSARVSSSLRLTVISVVGVWPITSWVAHPHGPARGIADDDRGEHPKFEALHGGGGFLPQLVVAALPIYQFHVVPHSTWVRFSWVAAALPSVIGNPRYAFIAQ